MRLRILLFLILAQLAADVLGEGITVTIDPLVGTGAGIELIVRAKVD